MTTAGAPERVAKRIARSGFCSRRDAERLIAAGRVAVDGAVLTSPAVTVTVTNVVTVDGEPVSLEAADVSTWVRRDGRWLCALHTESLAGDPFGRDRQPSA